MVRRIFQALVDNVPRLYKPLWKLWYNLAARMDGASFELRFMNFGFASLQDGGKTMALDPADEKHRWCIQLYIHALAGDAVEGKDMLEVGCGRGGGAAALMTYARPATLAAMDLSSTAIAMAREHIRVSGLTFIEGSADHLPFPDGSFDAVLNVESSHCYPSVPAFLAEVGRVLRPGGRFYYADFRPVADYDTWKSQIAGAGLRLVEEVDIRPNVLRALDLDSDRKRQLIQSTTPRPLRGAFETFACVAGSENYLSLKEGRWVYVRFVMEKTGA